ncbi:hypothetical protein MTR_1g097800 [Medicago truncatula]|uniref:Uncharacterized protein n=1 Tax=Medicago truncatula TaxID=3880 RepID=G7IAK0_MEDTR|nr:hypothetical protein MTR_1g097800 [Medicago truncatula]
MMDLGDEIFKVLDNFKSLRIDAGGAEARVEEFYKEFTDLKSRSNSLTKSMQEYQIPSHELYQGVFNRIDRLESMFQLLFNDLFRRMCGERNEITELQKKYLLTATYMAEVVMFDPGKLQRALTCIDAETEKNEEIVTNFST